MNSVAILQFRNWTAQSRVGFHSGSLSIPEIEQAKANSPSILFISTFSQFRSFAVFNFSFSTASKKTLWTFYFQLYELKKTLWTFYFVQTQVLDTVPIL